MNMSVKAETTEPVPLDQELRPDRACICRALIEERRLVRNGFGPLCTNANWDMLLALYIADIEGCAGLASLFTALMSGPGQEYSFRIEAPAPQQWILAL